MKNGKKPTLAQKKLLKSRGLIPENWLVVKDMVDQMEVVSRIALKKIGTAKVRTKIIRKEEL